MATDEKLVQDTEVRTIHPTIANIAAHIGLSRATVTHVLNGRAEEQRIRPETQLRVREAARELGYRPNALARSVRSGKSRMIGYLVSDPHYEPYWNTIIGALAECEEQGYTLKLLSVTEDTLAQRIQQCMELRLDGLLVRVYQDLSALFKEANRAHIPVVTVDEDVAQPFGVRVGADDTVGCREALAHLVQLGHRKIGFISNGFPPRRFESMPSRERLFRQEMAAQGLEVPQGYVTHDAMLVYGPAVQTGFDTATVVAATKALLEHPAGRPTAIFCWRDETALVAMRACRLAGLRVPEEISVVGFSDIQAARLSDPALSTCQSPWDEMGRTAVRQLVRVLSEEFDPSSQTVLIASGFVARQSSGPAPA